MLVATGVLQAAAVQPAGGSGAPSGPVWPGPPDQPRIAWVQSVSQPTDLGAKISGLRRAANWLTGDRKGNELFRKPFGIALDEAGNLCLTDTDTKTVSFYNQAERRWTRWERIGDLRFTTPVAAAKKGNLICVADSGLAAVIGFDPAGKLRFKATDRLHRPSGLVIAGERIYVADSQLHAVLVFDFDGRYQSQFGQRGTGPGEFNFPTHVAADQQGQFYVTDSMNGRVQILSADGVFRAQIGGAGDAPGFFSRPKGVAVDRLGHIYVIDALADNIQIFNNAGQLLLHWGQPGQAAGEFWLPNGIAIGSDDRIYVADTFNRRVQVFRFLGEP